MKPFVHAISMSICLLAGCPKSRPPTEEPQPPAATARSTLSVGKEHACFIDDAGGAQCWGSNESYQLGLEERFGCFDSPTAIPGMRDLVQITSGEFATCALGSDGRVTCWGGVGDYRADPTDVPYDVPEVTSVVKLVAGASHACALHPDGTVTCWGNDQMSQLGRQKTSDKHHFGPGLAEELPPAVDIAAGGGRSCAVGRDGLVRCWGHSMCDWTGAELEAPERPRLVPGLEGIAHVAVSERVLCGITASGSIVCQECENGDLDGLRTLTDVIEVDVEAELGCALHGSGSVSCWDASSMEYVEAAPVPGLAGAVEIGVARDFACARDATGAISCWGTNGYGALGAGPSSLDAIRAEPVPGVTDVASIALTEGTTFVRLGDGRVLGWGSHVAAGELFTDATDLDAGLAHVCATRSDRTVHCWGSSQAGRALAWGHDVPVRVGTLAGVTSVAVADNDVCAVIDKRVHCWRTEEHAAAPETVTVTAVDGLTDVVRVVAGNDHFCALLAKGQVRCWGGGTALHTPALAGKASTIAARGSNTCAVVDGVPWCWRENEAPQALPGMTGVVEVAVGRWRTCVIRSDQTLACTDPPFLLESCRQPDPSAELAALGKVSAVAIASDYACALAEDGVHCWGSNSSGELGLAELPMGFNDRPVPVWPR